jgi:hypothetical protein
MSGRIKRKPKEESSESDYSSADDYVPTPAHSRRGSSRLVKSAKKEVVSQAPKSSDPSDEDEYESSDDDKIAKRKGGKKPKPMAKKCKPKAKTKPADDNIEGDKDENEAPTCRVKKKPPPSKKKSKVVVEEDSGDDSSNIDEDDEQNVKSSGRKKQLKKGACEFEVRKSEYIDHKEEWLSRPITKYTATYSLPAQLRRKKVIAALLSDLWGGERIPISTWINALCRLELLDEGVQGNSHTDISVPLAAYEVRNSNGGTLPLFLRPYEGQAVRQLHDDSSESLDNGNDIDLYLNTAGPIWCIAYAPTHAGSAPTSAYQNYFAVGTSRIGWLDAADGQKTLAGTCEVGDDIPYNIGMKHRSPNLLQIWGLKTQYSGGNGTKKSGFKSSAESSAAPAVTAVSLQYCVGLQCRGPVWKVAWSSWNPFGADGVEGEEEGGEDAAAAADRDRELREISQNFLGILAVVCGDGSCLVMVLPKSPNTNSSSSSSSSCPPAERVPVLSENSVCRWEVTVPRESIGSKYSGVFLRIYCLCFFVRNDCIINEARDLDIVEVM